MQTKQEYEQEQRTVSNPESTTQKQKPKRKRLTLKIIGIVILLGLVASFFDSDSKNKKSSTDFQNSDRATITTSTHQEFIPTYIVLEDENLTLGGVSRFEQRIAVPLGLSTEELKQTLLDAAWKLQKQKNASAVVIFGFREDDKKRNGGFSAGKCTIAPFGNWAKAMERHKLSDLQATIEISEAYSYSEPLRENGSSAFIKADDTELYKPDTKEFYAEDVILNLKKGTEVKILDSKRDISSFAVMDIYKVQIRLDKKRTRTGWVYGYTLTD